MDLIRNAYFTEPNDQSPWFYQRFLLFKQTSQLKHIVSNVSRDTCWIVLIWTLPNASPPLHLIGKSCKESQFEFKLYSSRKVSWFHVYSCSNLTLLNHSSLEFQDSSFTFEISFHLNSHSHPTTVSVVDDQDKTHELPSSVWERELESIQELLEIEPDCKCKFIHFHSFISQKGHYYHLFTWLHI